MNEVELFCLIVGFFLIGVGIGIQFQRRKNKVKEIGILVGDMSEDDPLYYMAIDKEELDEIPHLSYVTLKVEISHKKHNSL